MICLEAPGVAVRLALSAFTLLWTHSVEHTRWEEDWQAVEGALVLVESRVLGSGAGMEPGADAQLKGGVFRFRPTLAPVFELRLSRSREVEDWQLCSAHAECRSLAELLPPDAPIEAVRLRACPSP